MAYERNCPFYKVRRCTPGPERRHSPDYGLLSYMAVPNPDWQRKYIDYRGPEGTIGGAGTDDAV